MFPPLARPGGPFQLKKNCPTLIGMKQKQKNWRVESRITAASNLGRLATFQLTSGKYSNHRVKIITAADDTHHVHFRRQKNLTKNSPQKTGNRFVTTVHRRDPFFHRLTTGVLHPAFHICKFRLIIQSWATGTCSDWPVIFRNVTDQSDRFGCSARRFFFPGGGRSLQINTWTGNAARRWRTCAVTP